MAKKISDLTAISGGVFSDNDLFEVSVDTGGGSYVSRKILGSEVKTTIGGANIGNSDLTINTSGARKLILGGALTSDYFVIRNNTDSADYFKVRGDGGVQINGDIGINNVPNSSYYQFLLNNTASKSGIGIQLLQNNSRGIVVTSSSGTNNSLLDLTSTASLAGTHKGIKLNVANATTANYALEITAGDYKINHTGAHRMILGGALSTDYFTIRNSADSSDYFKVDGTGNVQINNEIGQGTTPSGTINYFMSKNNNVGFYVAGNYSSAAFQIDAGTGTRNFYCRNIPNNASGYEAQAVNAGTGTRTGFYSKITGSGATNNIGINLDASGATNNYAIQIVAGDIKTPSGLGQTGTYTFGGGSTGDIASMQFEKGVLIAVTTVP